MRIVEGNERENLKEKNERRSKRAEQGEAIARADQQIEEHHGPAQKNENLEEIRERTPPQRVTPRKKKCGLKNEAERDRGKVKPRRPIAARAERNQRVGEAEQ